MLRKEYEKDRECVVWIVYKAMLAVSKLKQKVTQKQILKSTSNSSTSWTTIAETCTGETNRFLKYLFRSMQQITVISKIPKIKLNNSIISLIWSKENQWQKYLCDLAVTWFGVKSRLPNVGLNSDRSSSNLYLQLQDMWSVLI